MAGSNENVNPLVKVQGTLKHLTENLQHETEELQRLADEADRRMQEREATAPVKPPPPKNARARCFRSLLE